MSLTDEDRRKFAETVFVVEADDFAKQSLWEQNNRTKRVDWKSEYVGFSIVIGECGGRPVNISVSWATLNGKRVAFWDAISQVVDYAMIEKWWNVVCSPKWDGGSRPARCNAMNFHHAIQSVEDQTLGVRF